MAFPLGLLLLGAFALLGSSSNRSGSGARSTPPPPTPPPTGSLPDAAFGPVRSSTPVQTPPPQQQPPPPIPPQNQLARAQAVEPGAPPSYSQTNIYQQGPMDRRTAALQLQEYLRTHTGARRQRNVVAYYQGILGTSPDGLDGPNTQIAIRAALEGPFQQPPQPVTFDPYGQPPQREQAKGTPGGWNVYEGQSQGSGKSAGMPLEQGKGY